MSQLATRSAVFLQEMGIGVQWKLRQGADEAAADPFVAAVQALADGRPEGDAPSAAAQHAVAPAVSQPAPASALRGAEPVAEPRPGASGVAGAVAAPQGATPVASPPAAAAPVVSVPPPAAPPRGAAAAPDDDSMAWFDDAPMPPPVAARPAPPRPSAPAPAAAPSRPAPASASASAAAPSHPAPGAAPSRPAPAVTRTPAPADLPEDESTAWFDDAPAPARAAPVRDDAIAAMDWDALKSAVATCTRCHLCDTRRNAVNGRGAANATWIAIAAAPSRLDEKDKHTISGEAGQLLDNMLKAIELKPESDVYVTSLVKCRPSAEDGADRAPTAGEVIACRPFLERELALTGAAMAMTFGQFAAKGLMMGPAARGKVMHYGAQQLPVVATYHPDDLLRKPEDKAKAWADLCLAKASHA